MSFETPSTPPQPGMGERAIDTAADVSRTITEVTTTLNLYMRLTALHRLLEAHPSLGRIAIDEDGPGGFLTEDALIAAARLELIVRGVGDERRAEFDAREFRTALDDMNDE